MPLVLFIVVFLQNSLTWLLKTLRHVRIRPLALPGKLSVLHQLLWRSEALTKSLTIESPGSFTWDTRSEIACFDLVFTLSPPNLAVLCFVPLPFWLEFLPSPCLLTWELSGPTWSPPATCGFCALEMGLVPHGDEPLCKTHARFQRLNKKTKNVKYLINNSLHDSIIETITFLIYWGKRVTLWNLISFGSF